MHTSKSIPFKLWLALFLLLPLFALAHSDQGIAGGFVSGLTHPIFGWDHVAAMVAVGLWGAFLGMPALWLLPVVFPVVMAMGGALGVLGIELPHVETVIAVSAIVLGGCIAAALKPPLWVAAIVVAVFAIFHGHAHGTELPEAANPFAYAGGFVLGTGLMHLAGIALGYVVRWQWGVKIVRGLGAVIAFAGVGFLLGFLAA
jgi:urease accessory protein